MHGVCSCGVVGLIARRGRVGHTLRDTGAHGWFGSGVSPCEATAGRRGGATVGERAGRQRLTIGESEGASRTVGRPGYACRRSLGHGNSHRRVGCRHRVEIPAGRGREGDILWIRTDDEGLGIATGPAVRTWHAGMGDVRGGGTSAEPRTAQRRIEGNRAGSWHGADRQVCLGNGNA